MASVEALQVLHRLNPPPLHHGKQGKQGKQDKQDKQDKQAPTHRRKFLDPQRVFLEWTPIEIFRRKFLVL